MNNKPTGELALKTLAMPANTNANGDIFGGWIVSQMDIAACILGQQTAKGKVVTVAIDAMSFHQPVKVGDVVSCFCSLIKVGDSSMKVNVETWITNHASGEHKKVTDGEFTLVAINEHGRPRGVLSRD